MLALQPLLVGPQGRFDFSDGGGEKQTGGEEGAWALSLEYPRSFPGLASVLLSHNLFLYI